MKALTCEMCGSTDMLKQDGVYVCQACGTKYTVEEARKMMVEGTVDVKGTVTIDTTTEVANLFVLVRRAMDLERYDDASDYCRQILIKDPNNWEANFYDTITKFMAMDASQLSDSATYIMKSFRVALGIVKKQVAEEDVEKVVRDMSQKVIKASEKKKEALRDQLQNPPPGLKSEDKYSHLRLGTDALNANSSITLSFGDGVEKLFGYKDLCTDIWKQGVEGCTDKSLKAEYVGKIKGVDSNYTPPSTGCYVATAVYGSYDCPEVWTLRRYRDFVLAPHSLGRLFVKLYYVISPKLVSRFGNNTRITSFVRKRLDRFVHNLRINGIDNSPYSDINW